MTFLKSDGEQVKRINNYKVMIFSFEGIKYTKSPETKGRKPPALQPRAGTENMEAVSSLVFL